MKTFNKLQVDDHIFSVSIEGFRRIYIGSIRKIPYSFNNCTSFECDCVLSNVLPAGTYTEHIKSSDFDKSQCNFMHYIIFADVSALKEYLTEQEDDLTSVLDVIYQYEKI